MADAEETDKDIIAEAKARFTRCQAWESNARTNALADARFANGDAYNLQQWDQVVITARGDRPCLTQNKVRQHNLHIVNDARQHKAAIKVTPTGGEATYEAAQVYSAIIRRIEYQSKAMDAYSTAIYHQVESGIGYVRVVTDYADDESFDQEIFIRRVKNPRNVFLDPDAQEYDKSDMRFGFFFTDTPRKEFEAKNPKAKDNMASPLDYTDDWNTKENVREAEYWRRGEKTDTLLLLADGRTIRESQIPPDFDKKTLQIVKLRDITEPKIEWFQLAGNAIVDRKEWLGKYIPLVPFIGEEIVIDGQMDRKGHTRALIDAQKMYNYFNSGAVEQLATQTKSPYIAPVRAVEGLETYWNTLNTVNHPYLPYNDIGDDGQPIAAPERATPPVMAPAYLQGMQTCRDDMMMVSGQYQAEMGAPGNERSGTAIQQRQREGDTATYHYIDNQAKGIRQVGRIVLDLIPKIYDTARVTKIMAEDGDQSDVQIDPNAQQAHQQVIPGPDGQPQPLTPEQAQQATEDPNSPDPTIIFNPNVGRYDVEADVGPSYGTQREEAANAFSVIMQQNPEAFKVVGDFWARNSDFPGADELAERLKKGLPPEYQTGTNPQVQALQQHVQAITQQGQQMAKQADAEVSSLKAHIVVLEEQAKDKTNRTSTDDYKAETERLNAVTAADPTAAKVLVRSMLSQLLGMPALPIMHAHEKADAEHQQEIMPPEEMSGAAAQPSGQA